MQLRVRASIQLAPSRPPFSSKMTYALLLVGVMVVVLVEAMVARTYDRCHVTSVKRVT